MEGVPTRKSRTRSFGTVRRLSSGRYQARYWAPDGSRYSARRPDGRPLTFDTKGDADAWLALRQSEMLREAWNPPAISEERTTPPTVQEYAEVWLRERQLEIRTREHYAQLLRDHIYPDLGDVAVPSLEPTRVRTWHADLKGRTGPTARSHAYGLLRTMMNSAVSEDELITANPCRVRGAGQSKRVKKIRPASLAELETIVTSVPPLYRLMVLLAAWCALRFGELAELRCYDIDLNNGIVHVRRGVVRTEEGKKVKGPKSDTGKRPVAVPPHLIQIMKAHLAEHAAAGREGLLFPSKSGDQLAPSTLYKVYYPARAKAGRSDLRFHDLRHTGAVLAASTGATLAELMARLGHSTPGAAMRYQHASEERDHVIAESLSKLVNGGATPISSGKKRHSVRLRQRLITKRTAP